MATPGLRWLPWMRIILTLCVFTLNKEAEGYRLIAPRNYTVFTSDIHVSYSMGNSSFSNSMVQLLSVPGNSVINAVGIPQGYLEGELTFLCSVIDYAGDFRFRLIEHYGGPTLIETPIMHVSWPLVQLKLPVTHIALTREVSLQFAIASKLCDAAHSRSRFWLDVLYYGKNDTRARLDDPTIQPTVVHRQELRDFTRMQDVVLSFPCDHFDQAGLYQVTFSSSNSAPDRPMAASNLMEVVWSNRYTLSASVESIFPCGRFLQVYYTQPECAGVRDKIRMYKQLQIAQSSAASPTNLYYVGEQRVEKDSTFVTFTCDKFDENVPGYCFKYASIANNGAVQEQTMLCLLSSADLGTVVHGGWSPWAQWTACSSSVSCGAGKRSRYRACDSPPPEHGGRFCVGDTVQWQTCSIPCKDAMTVEPADSYTPDPSCQCGCNINAPRGKIVGTTDRCRGSSVWQIQAAKGKVVQLEFEVFALDMDNRYTWVKVRDGPSQMSNLLLHQFGGQMPSKVRSSSNILLVELMSPYEDGYHRSRETFVASFKTVAANGSGIIYDHTTPSSGMWENTVTIVGVGLCIVIILATIAFACHYRISRRHKKDKKQQALLTPNGSMPNSPSHSHSLQSPTHSLHSPCGSNNVTFAPDTKDPAIGHRDYVLAKGVTTRGGPLPTVTDGRSRGYQATSPVTGGRPLSYNLDVRPGSASSHARHSAIYSSPLQSPYSHNAGDGDYIHDPQMLKAQTVDSAGYKKYRQQRNRSQSPDDSRGSQSHRHRRPQSPESQSSSTREPRNQSFKKAVDKSKGKDGVPLADEEDLSPSPTSPTRIFSPAMMDTDRRHRAGRRSPESIPMDSYNKRFRDSGIEDTPVGLRSPDSDERNGSPPETRPPVEGRDSGRRVNEPTNRYIQDPKYRPRIATPELPPGHLPPGHLPPGNYISPTDKPDVKPLPLRHIQRPDGQSPENHHTDDHSSHTPDSLSPVLSKNKLFPGNKSHTPSELSLATADGFEYDDYIPDLPGSYFTMDPHAYTLTWSNQQPWAGRGKVPSESSVSTTHNESHA